MMRAVDTSGEKGLHKKFHVVVTTNANIYQAWQVRVMYYWYKKQKAAQGPEGQMGGFTRVLHDRQVGCWGGVGWGHVDTSPSDTWTRHRLTRGHVTVRSRPFVLFRSFALSDLRGYGQGRLHRGLRVVVRLAVINSSESGGEVG